MIKYKPVALAVVWLLMSVSFLASAVVAAEKDAVTMKGGKIWMLHDGKEVGPIDRETTLSNGTKVRMNGKMLMKNGKEMQLQEGQIMMLDGKMLEGGKGTGK